MPGAGAPVMSLREESHDQNFVSPFYKSDQSQTAKAFFISEYPGLLFGGKLDATNIDITETKWAVATTSTSRLNLSNLFSSLMEKRDSKAAVSVHNPSHRHWSGMHWLYPSSFIPFGSLMHSEVTIKSSIDIKTANLLYDAAEATLREKSRAGGGHTGWSAVWGACLWARAARGEEAWVYMSRIFQKYSAPNLLGLHPSLTHFSPHNCDTCYIDPTLDRPRITSEFSNQAPQDRPTSSFHSDYSTYKERRRHGSLALEPLSRPLRSQMWGALGFGKGKRMRNFDARYESVRNDRGLETSDNAKVRVVLLFYFPLCTSNLSFFVNIIWCSFNMIRTLGTWLPCPKCSYSATCLLFFLFFLLFRQPFLMRAMQTNCAVEAPLYFRCDGIKDECST